MKTKILERTVDWSLLNMFQTSPMARDFIRRLLDPNPETRLTLTDALHHDWLAPHQAEVPAKRERTATPPLSPAAAPPRDVSMRDAEQDDGDLPSSQASSHYAVPGAFPGGSQPDPHRALQRRRKILDDAREKGLAPPEPSVEMLANATRDDAGGGAGRGQRPLKRKAGDDFDSSLSPMPEEEDEDEDEDEPGPSSRKGKGNGTPARRGPKAGRGRGGKAVLNAEDDTRVRRSNRLGQVRA